MIKFPANSKELTFKDIIDKLLCKYEILGNYNNIVINNTASIEKANENSLVFISDTRTDKIDLLNKTKAKLIICSITEINGFEKEKCLIIVDNPKVAFSSIINQVFYEKKSNQIHPTCIIHPDAKLHKNINLGPYCIIGNCTINEGVEIESNVCIYDNVYIEKNVKIQSGCIIGSEGFDYIMDTNGKYVENFPQIGGVRIEENVIIGANTCIQRGTLGDTIIKSNCLIDNMVTIAHNVIINENSLVIGHSHIGGSVVIGKNSFIGQSVSIANVGFVGERSKIGIGSTVIRSINDDESVFGNPAKKINSPSNNIS
jgi:UDP-3-O-[3-hydroxymyristoyl] glucosamine N-acyltransferase